MNNENKMNKSFENAHESKEISLSRLLVSDGSIEYIESSTQQLWSTWSLAWQSARQSMEDISTEAICVGEICKEGVGCKYFRWLTPEIPMGTLLYMMEVKQNLEVTDNAHHLT